MEPRVVKLVLLLGALVDCSAAEATSRICELAGTRIGLAQSATFVEPDQEGNGILAHDFDGDGSPDELKWTVTGSASLIPPDYSTVTLTLTSTHKNFALEQQRLAVYGFESRYYVVTSWVESEKGPWHKIVFAIGKKGLAKICSFSGKGQGQ